MNPVETFGEFSQKLTPTDLMLYAGVGIVLWVLFKDKLTPVQKLARDVFNKVTNKHISPVVAVNDNKVVADKDVFFDLVASWKQTRDLAVLGGCSKAVEVADQMFPFLSPNICKEQTNDTKTT